MYAVYSGLTRWHGILPEDMVILKPILRQVTNFVSSLLANCPTEAVSALAALSYEIERVSAQNQLPLQEAFELVHSLKMAKNGPNSDEEECGPTTDPDLLSAIRSNLADSITQSQAAIQTYAHQRETKPFTR